MRTILLSLAIALAGCATDRFIYRHYEPTKGGVYTYPGSGRDLSTNPYRSEAQNTISAFCNYSGYQVLSESNRATDTSAGDSDTIYIKFQCNKK